MALARFVPAATKTALMALLVVILTLVGTTVYAQEPGKRETVGETGADAAETKAGSSSELRGEKPGLPGRSSKRSFERSLVGRPGLDLGERRPS